MITDTACQTNCNSIEPTQVASKPAQRRKLRGTVPPSLLAIAALTFMLCFCSALAGDELERLVSGRFGSAVDFSQHGRYVTIPLGNTLLQRPVMFSCWVRFNSFTTYNIVMAAAPKSGRHWEVYTVPGTGELAVYMPQLGDFRSRYLMPAGEWHHIALRIEETEFSLYADNTRLMRRISPQRLEFDDSPLLLGRIEGEQLGLDGAIDDLSISHGSQEPSAFVPQSPAEPDPDTVAIFHFDEIDAQKEVFLNAASSKSIPEARLRDDLSMPSGNRFLDQVQDEAYSKSTLHGDAQVESESLLPVLLVEAEPSARLASAKPPLALSLDGEWFLKESKTRRPPNLELGRLAAEESEGVSQRWFADGSNRSSWRRVAVPTTVQNALLKIGEIKDPFWDTNTWDELHEHGWPRDVPWHNRKTPIEQKDWWFAHEFALAADRKDRPLRLCFDGIDYAGSFYLNGEPLGYHAGMFGGPEFDVTHLARFDRPNELVVRIDRVPDSWTGILKGSPGWGWHYGHLISMGIWRSVQIRALPPIEVTSPFVKTKSIGEGSALLEIEYYVWNRQPEPAQIEVVGSVAGKTFDSELLTFVNRATVPSGQSRLRTEAQIVKPRLWWPMNYGPQDMYTLSVSLRLLGSNDAVDAAAVDFGIRTIEMRPLRGAREETDYRWQFVVNGLPVFIKGANWCWSDPMLQLDPAKYEHLLELARRAGVEMFRCWGGGIIETDEFYRLCDAKGIMVYQEFPYCWGPPDFPMTDPAVLDQQVSRVVKRLRNHPSLVMWGGGNENLQLSAADEALFLVGRRCRQYDPTRPFHRTDPWGGSYHNWEVFHGGLPIDSGFVQRPSQWYGEFGLPSMTNRAETLKYLPAEKLDVWPPAPDDGGIIGHLNQFSYRDMVKVMRYADYGPITSWDRYIEYSQMAQGEEISFAANLQRAGSYLNKGGLWFYKMTDLFPGQSWAVVGFYGQPKLSYFRAKQVYRPRTAYATYGKFDWEPDEAFKASIHVNNDSAVPLENTVVKVIVYGSDLREQWAREYAVASVPAASRVDVDRIQVALSPEKAKPFLLAVSMRTSDGRLISDQWYWFNSRSKTDPVRSLESLQAWTWPEERAQEAFKAYAELPEARLLTLPRTRLSASLRRHGLSGAIKVKNETGLPAFNVIIDNFPYEYGSFLEDNSFFLYPNEEREIAFDLTREDQLLDQLSVRAWNAPTVPAQ